MFTIIYNCKPYYIWAAAGASLLLVGGGVDHRGRAAAGASSLLVGGVGGGVDHRGRAAAGASLLLVGGIYAAASPGGHATRLHSAADSLISESKFRGRVDGCNCFDYQLFRCPFWDGFHKMNYQLKR